MSAVLRYRTCIYLYVYKVAIDAEKCSPWLPRSWPKYGLQTADHSISVKTEVLPKEGIWSGLFSVQHKNGDQYYGVGPLCPIVIFTRLRKQYWVANTIIAPWSFLAHTINCIKYNYKFEKGNTADSIVCPLLFFTILLNKSHTNSWTLQWSAVDIHINRPPKPKGTRFHCILHRCHHSCFCHNVH